MIPDSTYHQQFLVPKRRCFRWRISSFVEPQTGTLPLVLFQIDAVVVHFLKGLTLILTLAITVVITCRHSLRKSNVSRRSSWKIRTRRKGRDAHAFAFARGECGLQAYPLRIFSSYIIHKQLLPCWDLQHGVSTTSFRSCRRTTVQVRVVREMGDDAFLLRHLSYRLLPARPPLQDFTRLLAPSEPLEADTGIFGRKTAAFQFESKMGSVRDDEVSAR